MKPCSFNRPPEPKVHSTLGVLHELCTQRAMVAKDGTTQLVKALAVLDAEIGRHKQMVEPPGLAARQVEDSYCTVLTRSSVCLLPTASSYLVNASVIQYRTRPTR